MLTIDYNWISPDQLPASDDSQTMANLCICVGDVTVTTVIDQNQYYRNYITTPLYPLAEWLIYNWYCLFHESESIPTQPGFASRHNIINAAEGFLLPSLTIAPDEDNPDEIIVQWAPAVRWTPAPHRPPIFVEMDTRFVTRGEKRILFEDVRYPLAALIGDTIGRLKLQMVATPEADHSGAIRMEKTWDDVRSLDHPEYIQAAKLFKIFKSMDELDALDEERETSR